jgi:hypothetical protein
VLTDDWQVESMSEFEDRLRAAIERGKVRGQNTQSEEARQQATESQLRNQHSSLRLTLTEYIEKVIRQLIDHFPGFRFESVFGDAGWGAACWRDDIVMDGRSRRSRFSRFEMAIRPINEFFVIDLQARGTIGNRELFNRGYFQPIQQVDVETFKKQIDAWALEFAELYASKS